MCRTLTMLSMMTAVFRTTAAFSRSPLTSSGTRMDRHGDSTACTMSKQVQSGSCHVRSPQMMS